MTGDILMSPGEAAQPIAEIFKGSGRCRLSARDDRVFPNGWLPLGILSLEADNGALEELETMVTKGAFEWRLPSGDTVKEGLFKCLDRGQKERVKARIDERIDEALDQIAWIAVRAGLLHPAFDAAALEAMPFRRSTTVVADTSGALQGALDFVARHLHPAARVKVPAIVHMEIVNLADRFFKIRREGKSERRADELAAHLKSQGSQRVLLRLELQTDIEIERTYLLGDPLRAAFQPDRDRELSQLNISAPIAAYVDRLILEAARHHQAQSGPSHDVWLLTGDQGLARMALAEGVDPLYFRAVRATDFFGKRLAGQIFDPFSGDIRQTPLASVLWELATAFGAARLENDDGRAFEVGALGEGMNWSPHHSFDDLLWCKRTPPKLAPGIPNAEPGGRGATPQPQRGSVGGKTSFKRFDVGRLFRLVCVLDDKQEIGNAEVMAYIGTRSRSVGNEYRRFLLSADLISTMGERWRAKPSLQQFAAALRNERIDDIRKALLKAPSFTAFAAHVRRLDVGQALTPSDLEPSYRSRGAATYRVLGEVTLTGAAAGNAGFYPTPAMPDARTFAEIALTRFSTLDAGEGLVPVGAWLEALIREDGIHPEVARQRLDEADAEGFLRRFTEGSTPQMRHGDRVVHILRTADGEPVVVPIPLYRGDYLIPGKASVSLRIEGSGR